MDLVLQLFICIVLTYLYGSVIEYCVHRFLMHKPKPTPSLFKGHMHHHATYGRGRFTKPKTLEGRHKNLVLCLEHIFIFTLPLAIVVLPVFPVWSLILIVFGAFHYHAYNHLHSSMHLSRPPQHFPRWYAEFCYWTHSMHHSHPDSYFNVALPGADWLFGSIIEPTWADRKRFHDLKKSMYNPADLKAIKQDQEIIKSLNDCMFPSKYNEVGFVGPAPVGKRAKIGRYLAYLVVYLFVGDTQVVHLGTNYPKGCVYAFSHKSWKDVQVINHHFWGIRLMAAASVMRFMGGFLGLILGPFLGCWAAEGDGKGTAVKTGIKLVKDGFNVGVCPEGWAYMSEGPLHTFHNGTVRIAKGAGVPIVPVYIKYGTSAPKMFDKLYFPLQVLLNVIDPFQRATAFIVVGEAYIPTGSVEEETIRLQEKVSSLEPRY